MAIIELDVWRRKTRIKLLSWSAKELRDEVYIALLPQRCIALGEDAGTEMSREDMMTAAFTFLDHMGFPIASEEDE